MHRKTLLKLSAGVVLTTSLAACGSNNSPTPTPTPAPTDSSFQGKFGSAFAAIFNASATSDPVDPTDSSVPALAPAADPISD